jgi:hypothetical protein
MGDRNKKSKTGKTCGRPFKAPRPAKQAETDIVRVIEERPRQSRNKVKGVRVVPETEAQERSSDSEDNVPVASLLRSYLTLEQIQDCEEGPKDEKAVGVEVAKYFDGVQYRGTVDSWRSARKRSYYHVTYTDGDEEELSQTELRDGYVLGLSGVIEAQWKLHKKGTGQTPSDDCDKETDQCSNEALSDGEGSVYDKDSDEEIIARNNKRRRKEKEKTTGKKALKKTGAKNNQPTLAGLVLPVRGDKTVAGEAFDKLDSTQRELVTGKINKKTKQVRAQHLSISFLLFSLLSMFSLSGCEGVRQRTNFRCRLPGCCERSLEVPIEFRNNSYLRNVA